MVWNNAWLFYTVMYGNEETLLKVTYVERKTGNHFSRHNFHDLAGQVKQRRFNDIVQ